MNYRLLNSVGSWPKGSVISEKDINNDERLGGVDRLLGQKPNPAIQETTDAAYLPSIEPQSPNKTKGDNVDVGSSDTVEKRAARRADAVGDINDGTQHGAITAGDDSGGDAAAQANPRTGEPGKVAKANPAKKNA